MMPRIGLVPLTADQSGKTIDVFAEHVGFARTLDHVIEAALAPLPRSDAPGSL